MIYVDGSCPSTDSCGCRKDFMVLKRRGNRNAIRGLELFDQRYIWIFGGVESLNLDLFGLSLSGFLILHVEVAWRYKLVHEAPGKRC